MDVLANTYLRVAGAVDGSIVDGPAIRYALFVQGCPHNCVGCQNPETHDFSGGHTISARSILDDILKNPLTRGVTFSGGEPFCQAKPLAVLAQAIKSAGFETAAYTGFTFEQLLEKADPDVLKFLQSIDTLVDGRFDLAKKTLALPFVGSSNQRILDVGKSLEAREAVLDTSNRWHPKKY